MTVKRTLPAANVMLAGLKTALDGGFLFLFSGAVPAEAGDALDMVTEHTEVVKISESGDGVTGLTFDAAAGGVLSKAAAETWQGTAAFDGAEDAEPTLAPTFFRFCEVGDDGRAAATTQERIQGTVGGSGSGADLQVGSASIAAAAVQPIGAFGVYVDG